MAPTSITTAAVSKTKEKTSKLRQNDYSLWTDFFSITNQALWIFPLGLCRTSENNRNNNVSGEKKKKQCSNCWKTTTMTLWLFLRAISSSIQSAMASFFTIFFLLLVALLSNPIKLVRPTPWIWDCVLHNISFTILSWIFPLRFEIYIYPKFMGQVACNAFILIICKHFENSIYTALDFGVHLFFIVWMVIVHCKYRLH